MHRSGHARLIRGVLLLGLAGVFLLVASIAFAAEIRTAKPFAGNTVNGGTAVFSNTGGKRTLTWSDDFKIPGSPAPHWQVVDSKGNVYLLNRLAIKDNKQNRTIPIPAYVPDIAKVQFWCAWAEVLLGEAPFDKPVK
ncbi:MAG: hypothetical protein L0214_00595 [candidate division NC10 bacterium]|nr:hypothetical protein [candidate division NC10 bacterium]